MVNLENMRYIIDTSSILSQKDDEPHRRKINKTLWNKIDENVRLSLAVRSLLCMFAYQNENCLCLKTRNR